MERIFTAAGIAALLMLVTSFCVIGHDREAENWAREMETGMNSEEAAWTESMIQAVIRQDVDAGLQAERHLCGVTYDDVQLLARFMEAIARPGWAPRWKQLAGEVLINRIPWKICGKFCALGETCEPYDGKPCTPKWRGPQQEEVAV